MVLGKSFLLSLLITSQCWAQSYQNPAFDSWANPSTGAGLVFNIAKWFGASLSKEDKIKHRSAVYHALNNLENGEMIEWRNEYQNTEGKVQIAYTWPNRGLICRRVYSWVRVKESSKSYQDTACMDSNLKTWTFVDKY